MRHEIMRHMNKMSAPLALLVLGFALAACANAKPFNYESATEIPSGPGVMTGQKGHFTLYRMDGDGETEIMK